MSVFTSLIRWKPSWAETKVSFSEGGGVRVPRCPKVPLNQSVGGGGRAAVDEVTV
jgi:hypothetical protein